MIITRALASLASTQPRSQLQLNKVNLNTPERDTWRLVTTVGQEANPVVVCPIHYPTNYIYPFVAS